MNDLEPFDGNLDEEEWMERFEMLTKGKRPHTKVLLFQKKLEGYGIVWWLDLPESVRSHWPGIRTLFLSFFHGDIHMRKEAYEKEKIIQAKLAPPPFSDSDPSHDHPIYQTIADMFEHDLDTARRAAYLTYAQLDDEDNQKLFFRVLWDLAMNLGEASLRRAGMDAETASKKFNEGFEAGRKLGLEAGLALGLEEGWEKGLDAARRSMGAAEHNEIAVDTADLSKPPPSYISTPTQTSVVITHTSTSIQTIDEEVHQASLSAQPSTEPAILTTSSSKRLNWADDAESIPNATLIPCSKKPFIPRDLTVLRSKSAHPFSSLRRRNYRSMRPHTRSSDHRSIIPLRTRSTPNRPATSAPFISRSHPSGIGPGKPVYSNHTYAGHRLAPRTQSSLPPLDWDRDPRLVRLGRILGELGWVSLP
ncbi:hypothetical protein E1B28_002032 [Marasmius oreades]|uniref:Uncharacterized protein n=1 Tax=Marasmius oreades TaxID=181124 RepID=A0A9P8AG48_9AGAR|nr:uncharacterized protein E1B28_002032 [Marasmius oreades]KAG7100259.1 hypothetical protein E1B28_002032 [Marasmius oreades]